MLGHNHTGRQAFLCIVKPLASPRTLSLFTCQVHTTGMDIKQFYTARAALTLGKDMTFRDYAQVDS